MNKLILSCILMLCIVGFNDSKAMLRRTISLAKCCSPSLSHHDVAKLDIQSKIELKQLLEKPESDLTPDEQRKINSICQAYQQKIPHSQTSISDEHLAKIEEEKDDDMHAFGFGILVAILGAIFIDCGQDNMP